MARVNDDDNDYFSVHEEGTITLNLNRMGNVNVGDRFIIGNKNVFGAGIITERWLMKGDKQVEKFEEIQSMISFGMLEEPIEEDKEKARLYTLRVQMTPLSYGEMSQKRFLPENLLRNEFIR